MEHDEQQVTRPPGFPFEGLHVYQRVQEAWIQAEATADGDPLGEIVVEETAKAALGIARATACGRGDGRFEVALEVSRSAVHAAAAALDQRTRRGDTEDEDLRGLLSDSGRMLGALIRSLSQPREETAEALA